MSYSAGEDIQPNFDTSDALIPAIVQEYATGKVLMCAFMNRRAWDLTLETGFAHYYSRSRSSLWKKGETSGNVQKVMEIWIDCDADAVLMKVEQRGNACHTGQHSCFFRRADRPR